MDSFGASTSPPGQGSGSSNNNNNNNNLNHVNHNSSNGRKSYNQTTTPVKCDFCSYETTHRANMYRHKKTHTGVKNYECSICGVMTTRSDNLRQHMLAKHGYVAPHISHNSSGATDMILPITIFGNSNNNSNIS
ncbi:zinc finger protein 214-like [Galendromus occidentalis]|uniref:Zinc finger protein 214-like n=1 Tax=Galendromus occidentalis TaxID=34638 RepID=A0AAJ7WJD3_9ACAR|nr:zinc finger protein 214-like [Galendromus occidentalis]